MKRPFIPERWLHSTRLRVQSQFEDCSLILIIMSGSYEPRDLKKHTLKGKKNKNLLCHRYKKIYVLWTFKAALILLISSTCSKFNHLSNAIKCLWSEHCTYYEISDQSIEEGIDLNWELLWFTLIIFIYNRLWYLVHLSRCILHS